MGTELGPEVSLVSKVESGGDTIIGLLESDDLESADVIDAVEFARSTSSKGSAPNPNLAHLLDDMSEDVLNVTEDPVSRRCGPQIIQSRLPRWHQGARQGIPMPT